MGKLRKINQIPAAAVLLFCYLLSSSCKNPVKEHVVFLHKWKTDFTDSKQPCLLLKDGNNPLKYYSRANLSNNYGCGSSYYFPDSLVNKEIRVCFKCLARYSPADNGKGLVICLQGKDQSLLFYQTFPVGDYVTTAGTWQPINDSTQIMANINNSDSSKLTIYGYNPGRQGYIDVSDVEVELKWVTKEKGR